MTDAGRPRGAQETGSARPRRGGFVAGLRALLARGPRRTRGPAVPVVLYTRAVCPLCDDAKRELARVRTPVRWSLEVVSIDGDPELERLHGRSVPVVSIAGVPAFKGRLGAGEFARKLARRVEEGA